MREINRENPHVTRIEEVLAVADAYATAKELSEARVSTIVFNDGQRLRRVREENADLRSRTIDTAIQWFSDNWPKDATWPEGVTRPEPAMAVAS
jgi:hypothetical protein